MADKPFGRMQWRVLIATMIGYTLFYFMRKNFSFAMPGLEQDCGITKAQLGNFLFAGGIVYGVSKFLNGFVGDRVNSRKMLCLGLLACVLVNVAFGFVPNFAQGQTMVWAFGILLVLSQFFQGTGFPPCARLIAFWVPPQTLATRPPPTEWLVFQTDIFVASSFGGTQNAISRAQGGKPVPRKN